MDEYLIIDLPKTREIGAVMFWGIGSTVTTANPNAAMVVNCSYLDQNLERFDNGATTQAVLKSVVDEHIDQLEYLLHLPIQENVA
ncbi:hypothetical protein [Neptuniibacter marinus]|uniref:hypothetical protein n=1 Tax=Neptuniibacter marinus TaxID=1806670 RepID=UPI003B5A531E